MNKVVLEVAVANITTLDVDAIVKAANSEETELNAGALSRVVFCCFDEKARAHHAGAIRRLREG